MTYDQNSPTALGHVLHLPERLPLECCVTDCQHFVHDQDLRLKVGRHGKREANVHAGTVVLHRGIEEALHVSKGHDFVKLRS